MPKKYIPFIPEPVEGQAVLGNFNRILKYKGADDVAMTLQRGMPLYEMVKTETVGENTDGNLIIRGECVSACAYLKEQGIEVDLVYIDPPFASGADYAKKVYIRRNPKVAEAIAAAERELDIDELKAFEDKMYGDVWDKEKYLNWMYENLMAIKSVMSETATIFVHLDWNISHYVKILLDEIFGEANFINNIVWCYQTRQFSKRYFNKKHHDIFWYGINSANDNYVYHWKEEGVIQAYSEETIKKYKYEDDIGYYRLCGRGIEGSPIKGAKDVDPKWETTNPELVIRDYLKEGFPPPDYWMIDIENQASKERTEYNTQKPVALLEKIIKSASDKDYVIADFFGGSGTTSVVANRLGLRFIHCDVGINSIQTTRDRLKADGAAFDVLEIKDGVSLYHNPAQTMDKIKSLIPGLKDENSLDKLWAGAISDSKLGTIPVYLPDLKDSGTKLLDIVLMNRIIHQAIPDLDANVKKVIVYYVDITSEDEISKFIAEDDSTDVEIERRDLKTILDDVVVADYVEFKAEETHDSLIDSYAVSIEKFVSDRVIQKIDEFNQKTFLNSSEKKPYRPIEISEDGLELIEFVSIDCTTGSGEWHSDSEIKVDKLGYVIRNGEKTKEFWDGTIRCEKKPLRVKVRNICGDESVWGVNHG